MLRSKNKTFHRKKKKKEKHSYANNGTSVVIGLLFQCTQIKECHFVYSSSIFEALSKVHISPSHQ